MACMTEREPEMDIAERMSTYVDEFRRGLAVRHSFRHDDCLAESESARGVSWELRIGRFQLRKEMTFDILSYVWEWWGNGLSVLCLKY